jgi:pyridoxal phosphate enzyme (YggS family)
MSIAQNIQDITILLPEQVTLVAVSKTKPVETLLEAYKAGQRHFGENKVQEMNEKQEVLPADIHWHLIGHLQSNKVKFIAPYVHLIHSVDSLKLLQEINKQAKKNERIIDCLLQFHIAEEETKFGLSLQEAEALISSQACAELNNVRIVGIMGMATFTEDQQQIRKEFRQLKQYFEHIKTNYFASFPYFKEISMGMSSDYAIAIEEGSTLIRVGSSIFGGR